MSEDGEPGVQSGSMIVCKKSVAIKLQYSEDVVYTNGGVCPIGIACLI